MSESVTIKPDKKVEIQGNSVEIKPDGEVKLKGRTLSLAPAQSVSVSAQQVKAEGTMVEITSKASGKMEAKGIMEIKGGMVKIN